MQAEDVQILLRLIYRRNVVREQLSELHQARESIGMEEYQEKHERLNRTMVAIEAHIEDALNLLHTRKS